MTLPLHYRRSICFRCIVYFIIIQLTALNLSAQFREVYKDVQVNNNNIHGVFFISPSVGYAAFTSSIGYTQDSGRTFIQRSISITNTDYNGYAVNLTFGFATLGVHAFTQDSILAYGDFGAEPSILFSANGGLTWKLVFKEDFGTITNSIFDLKFSNSGPDQNKGIAISEKYIIQSTDRGQHWQAAVQLSAAAISSFSRLSMINNNAFAIAGDILYATNNTGASWNKIGLPPNPANGVVFNKVYFLNGLEGYVAKDDDETIYRTTNGGTTWTKMNDASICPVGANDIYFINSSTGFITSSSSYQVYKTINSGATWEACKKGSNYQLGFSGLSRLHFINAQQGWASANGTTYLLMTTNAGGVPLPKAFFTIDTAAIISTEQVSLINYSNPAYNCKWYKNSNLISTSYNASYSHDLYNPQDSIMLVVTNSEGASDTLVKNQYFNLPPNTPQIFDYTPALGGNGSLVTITGANFTGTTAVSFGTVPATSFVVNSATTITARVGPGASGKVSLTTPVITTFKNGFTYTQLPGIISFTPSSAGSGVTVNITGYNFSNATAVSFGGIPAASFTINSSYSITATVSGGASGNISITNPYGTTSSEGFTWITGPTITSVSPASAIYGTVVTVTGTNFDNTITLSVGGIDYRLSDYQVLSSTSIAITMPSWAESGDIVITTPGGTVTWQGFTFYKTPDCTSITPAAGTTGMPVVITGTNLTGASAVSIGGVPVSSFTVVSSTTINAIVGSGATGSVIVTNPAGTNNTSLYFTFTSSPVITGYSPSSAAVGSNVTILGGGFNINPSRNIVYIGGVKTTVINSSAYSITVKMVNGASGNAVTVTNLDTHLTGYSDKTLNGIFPAEATAFNGNSFGGIMNIPVPGGIAQTVTGDIDGDGKPDVLVAYSNASVISIFRNTSTLLQLSFAPKVDITVNVGLKYIALGDLDNDGKLDITGTKSDMVSNVLTIIQNKSTPGNILFGTYFTTSFYPGFNLLAAGDFNLDGKLDIVGGSANEYQILNNNNYLKLWIMENTSTNSVISFGATVEFYSAQLPDVALFTNMKIRDMNSDNKPDIILGTNNKFFIIYKNAGNGNIGFQPLNIDKTNSSFFYTYNVQVADFDNDGLADVLTLNKLNKNLGNFSFSSVDINTGFTANVADLNGDGKVDFVTTTTDSDSLIYVNKNTSSLNTVSFSPGVGYPAGADIYTFSQSADLDADGKPEIIYINNKLSSISILRNKIGSALLCPGGNSVLNSSITSGSNFQWQVNTGGGFINISDNTNYSGSNTRGLQLTSIPYSWNGYQYRCVIDGNYSDIYALQFMNSWTGSVSTDWENSGNWSCGKVPDSNTDVILNSGTVVLNSNVIIRSLKLNPGVQFINSTGFTLTITH